MVNYDPAGSSGIKKLKPKAEKENTPIFMRRFVTDYFLRQNPKYALLFHKCPSCGKNSLKPINSRFTDPTYLKNNPNIERHCNVCDYRHVPTF